MVLVGLAHCTHQFGLNIHGGIWVKWSFTWGERTAFGITGWRVDRPMFTNDGITALGFIKRELGGRKLGTRRAALFLSSSCIGCGLLKSSFCFSLSSSHLTHPIEPAFLLLFLITMIPKSLLAFAGVFLLSFVVCGSMPKMQTASHKTNSSLPFSHVMFHTSTDLSLCEYGLASRAFFSSLPFSHRRGVGKPKTKPAV